MRRLRNGRPELSKVYQLQIIFDAKGMPLQMEMIRYMHTALCYLHGPEFGHECFAVTRDDLFHDLANREMQIMSASLDPLSKIAHERFHEPCVDFYHRDRQKESCGRIINLKIPELT